MKQNVYEKSTAKIVADLEQGGRPGISHGTDPQFSKALL
jgi:hypothetical protein